MSSKFAEIEAVYGKPIKDVLPELYNKHHNLRDVANELGVSQGTISFWLLKLGLEIRSQIVPHDAEIEIKEPAL
jgi:hypothetical protein